MKTTLKILIILTFFSCRQSSTTLVNNVTKTNDTVIVLTKSINLIASEKDDIGLRKIKLVNIGETIFNDTINGYLLSKNYPKVLMCDNNTFQILLEVDNRPNFNTLKLLTINNNVISNTEEIPVFDWKPKDIDNDNILEISGYLTNGETISNGDTAFYNPKLIYKISKNGLILDSINTKLENIKLWGQFYGYLYNDTLLLKYDSKYQ